MSSVFDEVDHEQAFREARMSELRDLAAVLSTPEGMRFIRRLLARCAILNPTISSDAISMARAEAFRCVGLNILADIQEIAPSAVPQLLRRDEPQKPVTE